MRNDVGGSSAGTIQSIQALRGLAAVSVAGYHVYLILLQRTGVATFEAVSRYGYLGVPFFFVLSGFIVALAHASDINRPDRLARYSWNRVTRVYPIYWLLSLAFVGAALAGVIDLDFDLAPIHVIEHALLVHITPEFGPPPLKVAWTLFFEIRFYILFGLAIINLRLALGAAGIWLLAMVLLEPSNAFTREMLSYWNFSFFFGVVAAIGYRRLPDRAWLYFAPAGLVTVCVSLILTDVLALRELNSVWIIPVSCGFALLMLGLALVEKARPFRLWAPVLLLGDASYSVYLVHSAVIAAVVLIVSRVAVLSAVYTPLIYVGTLLLAIAAGIVTHMLLERPVMSFLKRHRPT